MYEQQIACGLHWIEEASGEQIPIQTQFPGSANLLKQDIRNSLCVDED